MSFFPLCFKRALLLSLLCLVQTTFSQLLRDSLLGLTEVAWHSENVGIYLGSPSIVRMSNGNLLVSSDHFGSGFHDSPNCSVFVSTDNGETWTFSAWAVSQYWSNLFVLPHDAPQSVYLIGTDSNGPSQIKIARSSDGGASFSGTEATVLFSFNDTDDSTHHGFETGPTPALVCIRIHVHVKLLSFPWNEKVPDRQLLLLLHVSLLLVFDPRD